jgi:hypothetical protein
VVDKHIFAAFLFDETETFFIVKPLDLAFYNCGHEIFPLKNYCKSLAGRMNDPGMADYSL